MTLGPVMLDLQGTELSAEDREILAHPSVGGVILFSRNYENPEQLADLVRAIRATKSPSPIIAVDQEGGAVQRFVTDFIKLPPIENIGKLYDADPELGLYLAQVSAHVMARELLACGVDISFAPVLDLKRAGSTIIGDKHRAFHADPEIVTLLGQTYIAAMRNAGMKAIGKHFPGHGTVHGDTHTDVLRDTRSLAETEKTDLIPFIELAPQLSGMMVAHVIYPEVDATPAGFSRFWVQDYLRDKLKFSGVIFTDALDMKGASTANSFPDRVRAAVAAGCDMTLVCNNRSAAIAVLDQVKFDENLELSTRIAQLRGRFNYDWTMLHALPEWRMAVEFIEQHGWKV